MKTDIHYTTPPHTDQAGVRGGDTDIRGTDIQHHLKQTRQGSGGGIQVSEEQIYNTTSHTPGRGQGGGIQVSEEQVARIQGYCYQGYWNQEYSVSGIQIEGMKG